MYKYLLLGYSFIISFFASVFFVFLFRQIAVKLNFVAVPKKDRYHSYPIPLLGGCGIVVSIYFVILLHVFLINNGLLTPFIPDKIIPYINGINMRTGQFAALLLSGVLIFLLGLYDDVKSLNPLLKIIVEVAAAVIVFLSGIRVTLFVNHYLWELILTVVWVVAVTNAFNLLDNIDGLSGGVAVISAFFLFVLCFSGGQILVSALILIFIGSVSGFLIYNFPPAKLFMGDAGSLFIGFFISVLAVKSTFYTAGNISMVPVVAPILILAVPIYDTISVICIRLKNGKNIFCGDKNHFSHRLIELGMTPKEALIFIYMVSVFFALGAIALMGASIVAQIIILLQGLGILILIYLLERLSGKKKGE